jgi:flagellar motor protein MotB
MGNGAGPIPIVTSDPKDDLRADPTVQPSPTIGVPEPTPTAEPSPVPTSVPTRVPTKAPTAAPKPTVTPKPSQLKLLYEDLNKKLHATSNTVGVDIEYYNNEVRIRIVASILFEPGSDTLTPQANDILTIIAGVVDIYADKIKTLHTEGHTDSVSELDADIQSKWELAGRRAAHVLQFLCNNCSIDANSAYTMGYGSSKPVATNDTPESRDKNNRVDIVIIE